MRTPPHLTLRGVACALIGVAVLLGPRFVRSPDIQAMLAGAAAVGWLALVLGVGLAVAGWMRR